MLILIYNIIVLIWYEVVDDIYEFMMILLLISCST